MSCFLIVGLLMAFGAKRIIPSLLFQEDAERLTFVSPVAFLITSSVVCVSIIALAGMMPIFATVTDRPWTVLQREQGFSSAKVVRLRAGLAVLQIALCCALVIFATLLLQGFHNALKTGIGQKLGSPILVTVQSLPPPPNIPADYFKAVEKSAKSVPDLVPATWTTQLPGGRSTWQSFRIQAASLPLHEVVLDVSEFTRDEQDQPEDEPTAGRSFAARDLSCRTAVVDGAAADAFNFVSSSYMQALGLPLIAGPWFSDPAQFSDSCRRVGVVNQEAADLFFGGKPLGAGLIDQTGIQIEIIGVVRSQTLGVFQQYSEPTVFIPAWQGTPLRMALILKAPKADDQKMAALRSKVESVPGRHVAAPVIETLDTQLSLSAFSPLRIATLIAVASALAALTVSMIGVFSIQNDVHHERRKILSLHLAFGVQGWRILLKSLVYSGRLVFAGCAAGALLSMALQRLLLSGTGLIGRPPFRAWLLALLLPAVSVLISGTVAALRSLSVHPMAIMRDR